MNRHDRRHSGRKVIGQYPYEETVWDDWVDYRDGMRAGPYEDYSKIKPKVFEEMEIRQYRNYSGRTIKDNNYKLKKENKIREVMKHMTRLKDENA